MGPKTMNVNNAVESNLQRLLSSLSCTVCWNKLNDPVKISCEHRVCKYCLNSLNEGAHQCPECSAQIVQRSIIPDLIHKKLCYQFDFLIQSFKKEMNLTDDNLRKNKPRETEGKKNLKRKLSNKTTQKERADRETACGRQQLRVNNENEPRSEIKLKDDDKVEIWLKDAVPTSIPTQNKEVGVALTQSPFCLDASISQIPKNQNQMDIFSQHKEHESSDSLENLIVKKPKAGRTYLGLRRKPNLQQLTLEIPQVTDVIEKTETELIKNFDKITESVNSDPAEKSSKSHQLKRGEKNVGASTERLSEKISNTTFTSENLEVTKAKNEVLDKLLDQEKNYSKIEQMKKDFKSLTENSLIPLNVSINKFVDTRAPIPEPDRKRISAKHKSNTSRNHNIAIKMQENKKERNASEKEDISELKVVPEKQDERVKFETREVSAIVQKSHPNEIETSTRKIQDTPFSTVASSGPPNFEPVPVLEQAVEEISRKKTYLEIADSLNEFSNEDDFSVAVVSSSMRENTPYVTELKGIAAKSDVDTELSPTSVKLLGELHKINRSEQNLPSVDADFDELTEIPKFMHSTKNAEFIGQTRGDNVKFIKPRKLYTFDVSKPCIVTFMQLGPLHLEAHKRKRLQQSFIVNWKKTEEKITKDIGVQTLFESENNTRISPRKMNQFGTVKSQIIDTEFLNKPDTNNSIQEDIYSADKNTFSSVETISREKIIEKSRENTCKNVNDHDHIRESTCESFQFDSGDIIPPSIPLQGEQCDLVLTISQNRQSSSSLAQININEVKDSPLKRSNKRRRLQGMSSDTEIENDIFIHSNEKNKVSTTKQEKEIIAEAIDTESATSNLIPSASVERDNFIPDLENDNMSPFVDTKLLESAEKQIINKSLCDEKEKTNIKNVTPHKFGSKKRVLEESSSDSDDLIETTPKRLRSVQISLARSPATKSGTPAGITELTMRKSPRSIGKTLFLPESSIARLPINTTPNKTVKSAIFSPVRPQQLLVSYSSIDAKDVPFLEKFFRRFKQCKRSANFVPKVTHMVVPETADNCAESTYKVMLAILNGVWIVSMKWIKQCLEQDKLLEEEAFEVLSACHVAAPRKSRLSKVKLFKDFEFYCAGEESSYDDISNAQLKEILTYAGGRIIEKSQFKNCPCISKYRVVLLPSDEIPQELQSSKFPIITIEWIFDCIEHFSLASVLNYLQRTIDMQLITIQKFPQTMLEVLPDEEDESNYTE